MVQSTKTSLPVLPAISAQPSLKATIPPPAGAVFKGSRKH
jgi:hypothetical protein